METIIIAILGSSAFTAIINGVIELIKNRSGAKKNADKGIMFSLLYCIQAYSDKLLAKDNIDLEDYKQFEEMYSVYKAMGGNGYLDKVKKEIDALPVKK